MVKNYNTNMEELTKIEKRVLIYLIAHGLSEPITAVSKKLRIKTSTLSYILKKMESRGWIKGYRYRLNPLAFGYSYPFWFFVKARHHKDMHLLDDAILNHPEVYSTNRITGPYDIAFLAFFRNQYESADFMNRLVEDTSKYMRRIYSYPVLSLEKFHNIEIRNRNQVKLDKRSIMIINYLMENPVSNVSKIASDLGLHRDTVSKRLKWMKDNQVIIKRSVVLDKRITPQLGLAIRSILFLNVEPSIRKKALTTARREGFVHEMFLLGSRFDSLLLTRADSVDCLYSNIQNLFSKGIAVATETSIVFYFKEKDSPIHFLNDS